MKPTNRSPLPEKGTKEAEWLLSEYSRADGENKDLLAHSYHYSSRRSFMNAMRERYGAKRGSLTPFPLEDLLKEQKEPQIVIPPIGIKDENGGWEPSGLNIPLKIETAKELKTGAFLFDTQNPYQDAQTLELVERFLGNIKPDYLFYGGDNNDFYGLSSFNKNPKRIDSLQDDVDNTRRMFDRQRNIIPNAESWWLIGNHEDRLQKFLWTNAPALSSLRSLQLPELFTIKDYNIKLVPYEQGLMINGVFLALHGDLASIHSGYTAKRMFEKHGGCGISGHCHRLGSFYKRDRFGTWGWWEGGCLCHLNPDWIKNPNWVQGFSLIHFRGKRFWIEQIPILDHKFIYGGEVYE